MATAGVVSAVSGPAAMLPACSWKSGKSPRLVLLYVPCTVNKQCLAPFNPAVGYTPNIQQFAAEAAVFPNCQVEAGVTGISYASLFSGVQADQHGIFSQPSRMKDSVYLITEAFAANGFEVYFWGGHIMASYDLNYAQKVRPDRAFSYYLTHDDPHFETILKKLEADQNYRVCLLTNFTVTHSPYYPAFPPYPLSRSPYKDRSLLQLNHLPEEFQSMGLNSAQVKKYHNLYQNIYWTYQYSIDTNLDNILHFFGLSSKEKQQFIKATEYLYKVNIARLDRLFGDILTRIKKYRLFEDSLIVFTADHGEVFYRDNTFLSFAHGELEPEVLSVPLLVSAPFAGMNPVRTESLIRSTDIFFLVAELAGIRLPGNTTGKTIVAALKGKQPMPSLPAYSHTGVLSPSFYAAVRNRIVRLQKKGVPPSPLEEKMLRSPGARKNMDVAVKYENTIFKLYFSGENRPQKQAVMFHHAVDPEERRNRFDPSNARHQAVMNDLKQYRQRLTGAYRHQQQDDGKDGLERQEKIKRLKELGYI